MFKSSRTVQVSGLNLEFSCLSTDTNEILCIRRPDAFVRSTGLYWLEENSFTQARYYKIILKNDMYEAVEERPLGQIRSEMRYGSSGAVVGKCPAWHIGRHISWPEKTFPPQLFMIQMISCGRKKSSERQIIHSFPFPPPGLCNGSLQAAFIPCVQGVEMMHCLSAWQKANW